MPQQQTDSTALAWVESPLQLLGAAEWAARRIRERGAPTAVAYRISDPQVVATAEALHEMGAPFSRYEPYLGIPWTRLASARHWVIGDPLSGQFRAAVSVLRAPRRLSVLDDGAMIAHTLRAVAGELPYARPGQHETGGRRMLGELAGAKLRRLAQARRLDVLTAFPAAHAPAERLGAPVTVNDFAWLRAAALRGDAPRVPLPVRRIALGTARVADELLSPAEHLAWVRRVASGGPVAYLPHRREPGERIEAVAAIRGVTVVRTGLPVELALAGAAEPLELYTLPSSATTTLAAVLAGTRTVIRTERTRNARSEAIA
ncbi:MAG: hypothetical protein QM598_01435 [Protaetiibacter sp.]